MDMSQDAAIRQAEVTDLPNVEAVARATWPITYAGIIPDEVQRRLLDSWYSPGALSLALAAPGSTFLVAEWGAASSASPSTFGDPRSLWS
jgi:hypothetical protein